MIREARRRRRKRRLSIAGLAFVLLASAMTTAAVMGGDRSGSPNSRTPAPPAKHGTAASPTVSAGSFEGAWHAHTTSITFASDGTGTAQWPGPVAPGGSEATAVPNRATVRLTAVHGDTASGVVTGSTDQTELPNGPLGFRITQQDLLVIVPSHPIAVTPLRWSGLCGATAAALPVAQQVAEGINCGA